MNPNDQPNEPLKPKNVKKRRDKSDLGDHFVAPDGGWGWVVCVAAGLSNLFGNAVILTFGLIFRQKLSDMGFSNSEMTTIFNSQQALASSTGLLNGAMFRRFSYRQIALVSAITLTTSIFLIATADTFFKFILFFSVSYGCSLGISTSATALALNTYFKEKRRRAVSFAWTLTGLGPFFMPYLITYLIPEYGSQGTLIILAGFSMNAISCALLYQPVKWHVKKPVEILITEPSETQTFHSKDDNTEQNEEVNIDYGLPNSTTPMLSRVNDGWYGSKLSLSSVGLRSSLMEINRSCTDFEKNFETLRANKSASCLNPISTNYVELIKDKISKPENSQNMKNNTPEKFKWYHKIVVFFDLDLLKDVTYVNLLIGITMTTFSDMNFSILTPFFLNEFKFTEQEIAMLMSVIGGADIIVRFLLPFFIDRLKWDNRVFFVIAVIGVICGRITISQKPSFSVAFVAFIWMGMFKGLRTIFQCVIIPDHVELKRLPAASGLQLVTAGIFTLLFGPIVGTIRDFSDYTVTINFLNLISATTVISWTIELLYRSYQKHKI